MKIREEDWREAKEEAVVFREKAARLEGLSEGRKEEPEKEKRRLLFLFGVLKIKRPRELG
jgi:hypothetical protein